MKFQIPASKKSEFTKLIAKSSTNIGFVTYTMSDPHKETFRHHSLDGTIYKVSINVIDVELDWPVDNNGWKLVGSVKEGVLFMNDKKHEFSNGHGPEYDHCDCCNKSIVSQSYILYNTNTKEEVQVGAECAKKYGINYLKDINKLVKDLYGNFIVYISSNDDPDGEFHFCRSLPEMSYNRAYLTKDILCNAKIMYDINNGTWVKGETLKDLNEMIDEDCHFSKDVESYVETLTNWIKNDFNPTTTEFDYSIKELGNNKYSSVFDSCFAFFAIKKFEESKKEPETLKKDDFVKIVGSPKYVSYTVTKFGPVRKYEILNEIDNKKYMKESSTELDENNKIEGYSKVKFVDRNGNIYLSRILKKQKEGTKIANINE